MSACYIDQYETEDRFARHICDIYGTCWIIGQGNAVDEDVGKWRNRQSPRDNWKHFLISDYCSCTIQSTVTLICVWVERNADKIARFCSGQCATTNSTTDSCDPDDLRIFGRIILWTSRMSRDRRSRDNSTVAQKIGGIFHSLDIQNDSIRKS
jgi:hypothetical protein